MDKPTLEELAARLQQQQEALAQTVDQLKQDLSPAAVADWAKAKTAQTVKAATLEPSGRPKTWLLVAVSLAVALVATGVAVRLSRRVK